MRTRPRREPEDERETARASPADRNEEGSTTGWAGGGDGCVEIERDRDPYRVQGAPRVQHPPVEGDGVARRAGGEAVCSDNLSAANDLGGASDDELIQRGSYSVGRYLSPDGDLRDR